MFVLEYAAPVDEAGHSGGKIFFAGETEGMGVEGNSRKVGQGVPLPCDKIIALPFPLAYASSQPSTHSCK